MACHSPPAELAAADVDAGECEQELVQNERGVCGVSFGDAAASSKRRAVARRVETLLGAIKP